MDRFENVLLFFTGVYPYGRQEAFIENEIGYLSKAFDRVIVLPQASTNDKRAVPNNIEVCPLPKLTGPGKSYRILAEALRVPVFWKAVGEITGGRSPLYRLRTLASYVGLATIYCEFIVRDIAPRLPPGSRIFLYSYWMDRGSLAMVFLAKAITAEKVVCRVHGFDVYEERNSDGYLPLRRYLLERVDAVHAISEHAAKYLAIRYPGLTRYKVSRLGTTRTNSNVEPLTDVNAFHIVSVSNVVPVKRVAMIAEVINRFASRTSAIRIKWTHFGDGTLFAALKEQVASFAARNLEVDLKGGQLNSVVKAFYADTPVDLFLNLSESEGIPVSFMEAMSYGVPVMATNVGGVEEILNNDCGFLVDAGATVEQVVTDLCSIASDRVQLLEKSQHSSQLWRERYSADMTYPTLVAELLGVAV